MKTHTLSIAVVSLLLGILMAGCTTNVSETPYPRAVENVKAMLEATIDEGIFPFTKDTDDQHTIFRFIEGSRDNKVDHATPLRVAVTITPHDEGSRSAYSVRAYEHGLTLKTRDRDAENRWNEEVEKAIEEEEKPRTSSVRPFGQKPLPLSA